MRLAPALGILVGLAWFAALLVPPIASSGNLLDDPKGFQGIVWGSALTSSPDLALSETGEHVNGYDLKGSPPPLGDAKVESVRFYTYDGAFARVIIRYRGKTTHEQVMLYLQTRFGPIERTPGQMTRGLNQQYNWRGPDTEINLTYDGRGERGFVFVESRTLAPRFNDSLSETGY